MKAIAAGKHRIERAPEHLLQMMLRRIVRRMRLAGKDDLHRPIGGRQDAREPLRGRGRSSSGRL